MKSRSVEANVNAAAAAAVGRGDILFLDLCVTQKGCRRTTTTTVLKQPGFRFQKRRREERQRGRKISKKAFSSFYDPFNFVQDGQSFCKSTKRRSTSLRIIITSFYLTQNERPSTRSLLQSFYRIRYNTLKIVNTSAVAQLVERLSLTPEICGSNPVIGQF